MAPKINLILLVIACTAGCACARLGGESKHAARNLFGLFGRKGYGHYCTDRKDCKSDSCIRFRCADGTIGSTCDFNHQCDGSDTWCNAGKCAKKLSVDSGCNDAAQCASGSCIRFRCADGELDSTCDYNHQCKGSHRYTWCDAGRCKKKLPKGDGCNDGAQCSSGHCIRFKCADGTAGATCDNNAQCYAEDHMFCRAGTCISPKEEFSYREAKPECVTNVKDQGWCGSCWAFATATAASQRLCLGHKPLSSMDILCDVKAKSKEKGPNVLCTGGFAKDGLNHLVSDGAVRIQKFPTPFGGVPDSICADPLWGVGGSNRAGTDHTKLEAGEQYYDDGSGTDTPFRQMHWNEPLFVEKVKHALLTYGPVPVSMSIRKAFKDFRTDPACWAAGGGKPFSRVESKSCCKKHYVGPGGKAWCDEHVKNDDGGNSAHAMVIVGYGTFEGEAFWEVQNSWGTFEMGSGLMRIAQDYARKGDAGSEFYVTTSLPVNWTPAGLVKPADVGSVSCGNHRAATCGRCPYDGAAWRGESWCNGDCTWGGGSCGPGAAFHVEAWMTKKTPAATKAPAPAPAFALVSARSTRRYCTHSKPAPATGKCDLACCRRQCADDARCTHFTSWSDGGCGLAEGTCTDLSTAPGSWKGEPEIYRHEHRAAAKAAEEMKASLKKQVQAARNAGVKALKNVFGR